MKTLAIALFLILTLLQSACDNSGGLGFRSIHPYSTTQEEPREDKGNSEIDNTAETRAIVVYNADSEDSKEIAQYYAKMRNIPQSLLSGVHVPNSLFGTPEQLLSVRAQILNNTLCPVYSPGKPCDADNFEHLLDKTNLPNHLAIIKGIPTHLRETGWGNSTISTPINVFAGDQDVSFDYYLAYMLLNERATCFNENCFIGNNSNGLTSLPLLSDYSNYFRASPSFNNTSYTQYTLSVPSGQIPPLDSSHHRTFAYGRIDGIGVQDTKQMIDRTLYAEQNGPQGNLYGAEGTGSLAIPIEQELSEYTGSLDSACLQSTQGEVYPVPGNTTCRVGWNSSGNIPISAGGNVHSVENIFAFMGQDTMTYYPPTITQYGFINDFAKMLTWRHSSQPCQPLCSAITNATEKAECENTTLDPFKTINTACVGVEPGFFGTQHRSFPSQFMGVYPQGWKTVSMGPATASPMELSWNDGVQTSRFTDSRSIYFGDPNYRRNFNCLNAHGEKLDCDPKVELYAQRIFQVSPTLPVNAEPKRINISFHWKGYSAKPGRVSVLVKLVTPQDQLVLTQLFNIDVIGAQDSWKLENATLNVSSDAATTVDKIHVLIYSPTEDGGDADYNYTRIPIYGYWAIDGLGIKMVNQGLELISADAGSFNEPYTDNLVAGDWPGATRRLGGSAWFGSMSHYLTGGNAWPDKSTILRAFFSGNTLGQSLLLAGTGVSSLFYGDPLYTIGGAAFYLDANLFSTGGILLGKSINLQQEDIMSTSPAFPAATTITVHPNSPTALQQSPLYFDATFGTQIRSEYRIELCSGVKKLSDCEWEILSSGSGPIKNQVVPGTEDGIYHLARNTGYHFIRVKVFALGAEQNALYRIAKFYFVTSNGEVPPGLIFNIARFSSTTWDSSVQNANRANSLLNNLPLRYSHINQFIIQCNGQAENMGIPCSTESWTLQMNSTWGTSLPPFTRTEQSVFDFSVNRNVKRTTYSFNQMLTDCDQYNMNLVSTQNNARFLSVMNMPEDWNRDGFVSQSDYNQFIINYQGPAPINGYGDFDGDRNISQSDFNIFSIYFNCPFIH